MQGSPGRRMAGELGLEPRMTVPKTGVLPLHHSPAGPAQPLLAAGRRSDTPRSRGTQQDFQRNPHRVRNARNARLMADRGSPTGRLQTNFKQAVSSLASRKPHGYKPPPQVGVWLSLVEHCVRDAGVGGSNPLTPTIPSKGLPKPWKQAKEPPPGGSFRFSSRLFQRLQPAGDRPSRWGARPEPCGAPAGQASRRRSRPSVASRTRPSGRRTAPRP